MKLYSAWYCPFAQRAWMALLHKGIDFEYVEVDPYNKTELWLEISKGSGQVPVLASTKSKLGDNTFIDSNNIVEVVDRNWRETKANLYSENEAQYQHEKYWIDFISKEITPYFYRFLKTIEASDYQLASKVNMLRGIEKFVSAMDKNNMFFSGKDFGAVDIAFAPFAYRIKVLLELYRDFYLPTEGEIWERYHRWYESVIEVPAFKQSSTDLHTYESRMIDFYLEYNNGGGQQDITDI